MDSAKTTVQWGMGPVLAIENSPFDRILRAGEMPELPGISPGTRVLFWNRHRILGPFRRASRTWDWDGAPRKPIHCYRGSPGPIPPEEWPRFWRAVAESGRKWPRFTLTVGRFGGMDLVTWLPHGEPHLVRHKVLAKGPWDGLSALCGSLQGQSQPMARRDSGREWGRNMVRCLLGAEHAGEGARIQYHLPHGILPQGFYQGGFWGARHRLVRYRPTRRCRVKGLLPRRGVVVALGPRGDTGMEDESRRLTRFFHSTTLSVENLTGGMGHGALSQALEACRLFHFIGHGPEGAVDGGLHIGAPEPFATRHILSLARTPEVVFLSCCGDVEKSFVDAWFARGTRALVFPRGVLRSESMGDFSLSFYSHWRHHRQGIDGALLHARRLWGRRDWNGLMLELTGEPMIAFEPRSALSSRS